VRTVLLMLLRVLAWLVQGVRLTSVRRSVWFHNIIVDGERKQSLSTAK